MTDTEVRIRTAGPEDVPGIVGLSDALFWEDAGSRDPTMNLEWAAQEGRGYFADLLADDTAACWLAEHVPSGDAVGYLASRLGEANSLRAVRVATLESMYVRGEFRGRGVGSRLVERFLSWARERGAQRASVTAYAANNGAIRFYEREGFSPKNLTLEQDVGQRSGLVQPGAF
jgi:GNAT superfamily N-acetyltransferase